MSATTGEVQLLNVATAVPEGAPATHLFETITLKPYTSITFVAIIGANVNGTSSALWQFSGSARRFDLPNTISLTGINGVQVVADDSIFKETYIDIDTDLELGALRIRSFNNPSANIFWDADVAINQIP